jgi:hypothetical protein
MTNEPLRVPFTTDDIRSVVAWQDNYPHAGEHNDIWAAEFDRWLAEHDRQERERAEVWEYGTTAMEGDTPNADGPLSAAEHVRDNTTTIYRKWTHGNPVTIWRRRAAGPWEVVTEPMHLRDPKEDR